MYKPYVSGVTSYISQYKRFLELAGHEVYVFTFGQGIKDDEPNIIRSPGMSMIVKGIYTNTHYSLEAQEQLASMDVVHVHHPMVSARLAAKYCRPNGTPVVFTNHTRYDIYGHTYFSPLGRTYLRMLKKYLPGVYQTMDVVIIPSEKIKPILAPFGLPLDARVIPHGVDLATFKAGNITPIRASLGISVDALVLLYVGRLGMEKNLPVLMHSFRETQRHFEDSYLVMVGEGPTRKKLERLSKQLRIDSRVIFTGGLPYHTLPTYYHAADIFVMPSLYETFGFTVVEAMASGLPVVGYDVPGINDTVEDDVTGLLATPGVVDFSKKISQLTADPETRNRMGQNALASSEKFSIEVSVGKLMDIYHELAG